MSIRVLFLAANPSDTDRLQLDQEIRAITEKIRSAEHRDVIQLISAWAVRPDDLLQLLNQHEPQIVHFSGHGSVNGEIDLLDQTGAAKPVSQNALRSLFKTMKGNIRLVVLNACYSRTQAQAIVETIDCAVGMNRAIGDGAAIIFAASFYRALGFGRSVQQSFEQGKTALMLEGFREENTPELLCRDGVEPGHVYVLDAGTAASRAAIFTDEMGRMVMAMEGKLAMYRARMAVNEMSSTEMLDFQDIKSQQEQLLQLAPPDFIAYFYRSRY